MESKAYPLDGNETFDLFDVELHTLNENIQHEVMKVLKPFQEFLKEFDSHQVHNMLALILDPCLKSLQVVESFVGCSNAMCLAIEYHVKEVILFLVIVFY
jgi:hypothetical protein